MSCHIIIVSYHSSEDLKKCLPALAETTSDVPVTIVDNAAPDPELDWVRKQWQVVENPQNLGFGHGNNLAAKDIQADILVFLNPDTVPTKGWLEALIVPLEQNPSVGLATARIELLNQPGILNTAGNAVHLSGLTTCRGLNVPAENFPHQETVSAISGACFAIRRELYEQLHGFDDLFFLYMEDTDLSLRALLHGYSTVYVPDAVVYHNYEFKLGNHKIFYQERNRYLMLYRLFKWPTLLLLLPTFLMGEVISWGFVVLRSRRSWREKLQAYDWVITHWQMMQQRRSEAQATRRVKDQVLLRAFVSELDVLQFSPSPAIQIVQMIANYLLNGYYRGLLFLVRW